MDALFVNLITVANTEEVHTITELLLKSTPVVKAADAFGIADPSASRAMARPSPRPRNVARPCSQPVTQSTTTDIAPMKDASYRRRAFCSRC